MGFFKQKKAKESVVKKSIFDYGIEIHSDNWFEVFSACLGKTMANQKACSDIVVRGQNWNVDFEKGIISFGESKYPLQFIGSESSSSNSWLWGWENINGFSETILEVVNATKKAGEAWGLETLTTAKFEISDVFNGHNLSIVTCGINEKNLCYYRGPHSGGAIFVAFSGVNADVFAPVDIHTFISITMDCIQQFQVDHNIFVQSFLSQNGTPYEWSDKSIIAHFEQNLKIDFETVDDFLRISSMKSV